MRVVAHPLLRRRNADPLEDRQCLVLGLGFAGIAMRAHGFGDLLANAEGGVERGHRLLENHRHPTAAQLAHGGVVGKVELLAFENHLARADCRRTGRQQPHHRQRGHAFPATAFPDDAECLAWVDGEIHMVDLVARRAAKAQAEVTHFEQNLVGTGVGAGQWTAFLNQYQIGRVCGCSFRAVNPGITVFEKASLGQSFDGNCA